MFTVYRLFDRDDVEEIAVVPTPRDVTAAINQDFGKMNCFEREHVYYEIKMSDRDFFELWQQES